MPENAAPVASRWKDRLAALRPAPQTIGLREQWRAALSAGGGILLTGLLCTLMAHGWPQSAEPWLMAPLGASAVLVFALPGSPLAQPWAVVGGNTLSALAGMACVHAWPHPVVAGALAVSLAIGLMFACRCLHPPGGAVALLCVLNHADTLTFAIHPVLANSALLVVTGAVIHSLAGKRYPHPQVLPPSAQGALSQHPRFTRQDLDAVLARHNQVLDVSRDDLEHLLEQTEMQAYQRLLGELRCEAIMTSQPISVQFGSSLEEAWQLMRTHRIKALPVVDRWNHLVGILTQADFLKQLDLDVHEGLASRLRHFVKRSAGDTASKPEVVGQIMTRQVRVASADRHVVDLVPLFSEDGHHHVPIIDEHRRLVGIITQRDFVKALYRALHGMGPGHPSRP